jgi:hypothetical protein
MILLRQDSRYSSNRKGYTIPGFSWRSQKTPRQEKSIALLNWFKSRKIDPKEASSTRWPRNIKTTEHRTTYAKLLKDLKSIFKTTTSIWCTNGRLSIEIWSHNLRTKQTFLVKYEDYIAKEEKLAHKILKSWDLEYPREPVWLRYHHPYCHRGEKSSRKSNLAPLAKLLESAESQQIYLYLWSIWEGNNDCSENMSTLWLVIHHHKKLTSKSYFFCHKKHSQ